jgi:hypothetical protein
MMSLGEFLQLQFDVNRAKYQKLEEQEQELLKRFWVKKMDLPHEIRMEIYVVEKDKLNAEALFLRSRLDALKLNS